MATSLISVPPSAWASSTTNSTTAAALLLYWGTFYRAVGAENTTVSRLRSEQSVALRALMEKTTRIEGHIFQRGMTALRTRQRGFEHDCRRCHGFCAPPCTVEGKPAFVVAFTSADGFVLSPSYFTVAVLWS